VVKKRQNVGCGLMGGGCLMTVVGVGLLFLMALALVVAV